MKRVLLASLLIVVASSVASAQMVTMGTPFNRLGDSFHENIGTSWSLQGKNWSMNFGGNNALPGAAPFGNAGGAGGGIQGGVGFGGNGFTGNIWGRMEQGSSRSLVSQTPSVTSFNGVPAMMSDTQQTPFVISTTPVVGSWTGMPGLIDPTGGSLTSGLTRPVGNSPVSQALSRVRAAEGTPAGDSPNGLRRAAFGSDRLTRNNRSDVDDSPSYGSNNSDDEPSSADSVVGSVAQMKQLYQQEYVEPKREKARLNIEKARAAAQKGRIGSAKSYYKIALKYAQDDEVKKTIIKEYNALDK
ncbi:MAG: hypothetical protein IJF84_10655 [Thermoguttaceae bacterium]|nr:hypothetical protein [Thermoguttaceae bacterium]